MFTIQTELYNKLTEIIKRWEAVDPADSEFERTTKSSLRPVLAGIRGLIETPYDVAVAAPGGVSVPVPDLPQEAGSQLDGAEGSGFNTDIGDVLGD